MLVAPPVGQIWTNTSGTTYNWPNLEPMQVAFFLAGEITQVKESIPWVRIASGNVFGTWPARADSPCKTSPWSNCSWDGVRIIHTYQWQWYLFLGFDRKRWTRMIQIVFKKPQMLYVFFLDLSLQFPHTSSVLRSEEQAPSNQSNLLKPHPHPAWVPGEKNTLSKIDLVPFTWNYPWRRRWPPCLWSSSVCGTCG